MAELVLYKSCVFLSLSSKRRLELNKIFTTESGTAFVHKHCYNHHEMNIKHLMYSYRQKCVCWNFFNSTSLLFRYLLLQVSLLFQNHLNISGVLSPFASFCPAVRNFTKLNISDPDIQREWSNLVGIGSPSLLHVFVMLYMYQSWATCLRAMWPTFQQLMGPYVSFDMTQFSLTLTYTGTQFFHDTVFNMNPYEIKLLLN